LVVIVMGQDESIIDIIQKMVQEGQPRERIVQTLRDLGVSDDQAKKLLLIAEADTFTLLKKEINSLVKTEFASQRKDFEGIIHKDLESLEEEEKEKVKQVALSELSSVQEEVMSEAKGFEGRVNKTISSSEKAVSLVKIALDSLNNRIAQTELDIEQLKVHKFRRKSMFFSYAMLALGCVVLVMAFVLLFMGFGKLDSGQILVIAILILASITLMFASVIS